MVTVICTAPALPTGETTVIDVAVLPLNDVPGVLPNVTAVAPVRLVPVIVTLVPPSVLPLLGLTAVTVGAPALIVIVYVCDPVSPVVSVARTVKVYEPTVVGVPDMVPPLLIVKFGGKEPLAIEYVTVPLFPVTVRV